MGCRRRARSKAGEGLVGAVQLLLHAAEEVPGAGVVRAGAGGGLGEGQRLGLAGGAEQELGQQEVGVGLAGGAGEHGAVGGLGGVGVALLVQGVGLAELGGEGGHGRQGARGGAEGKGVAALGVGKPSDS